LDIGDWKGGKDFAKKEDISFGDPPMFNLMYSPSILLFLFFQGAANREWSGVEGE